MNAPLPRFVIPRHPSVAPRSRFNLHSPPAPCVSFNALYPKCLHVRSQHQWAPGTSDTILFVIILYSARSLDTGMDSEMDAHRPANMTRALTVRSKAVAVIDPRRALAKPENRGRVVARRLGQVPVLVVGMGAKASERFVTFFTDNIRNPHTRRAYHRWVCDFFEWCEVGGLDFTTIKS